MAEFLKGKSENITDIIDFINYIFSQSKRPHDFKELIPKLYGEDKDNSAHHYIAWEGDKIKAVVCAYPVTMSICGNEIKTCGIGSVSVHPYSRGSGYMKILMNMALKDMGKEGYAFSMLGGLRHRYQYFGYDGAGTDLTYKISITNLRHFAKAIDISEIEIRPLERNDDHYIDLARRLYKKQDYYCKRDSFYDYLLTWNAKPYVVLRNGDFIGYFSCNEENFTEFVMIDYFQTVKILKAFFKYANKKEICFELAEYQKQLIDELSPLAEECMIENNCKFNILDFRKTIKEYLRLKASYSPVCVGRLSVEVENHEKFEIIVQKNGASVTEFEGDAELVLDKLSATELFFSPTASYTSNFSKLPAHAKQWFPLPLHVSSIDNV